MLSAKLGPQKASYHELEALFFVSRLALWQWFVLSHVLSMTTWPVAGIHDLISCCQSYGVCGTHEAQGEPTTGSCRFEPSED